MSAGLLDRILGNFPVLSGPNKRSDLTCWCVFHAGGEGSPLHQPNLHVGSGFKSHGCQEHYSPRALADRLGVDVLRAAEDPEVPNNDRDGHALRRRRPTEPHPAIEGFPATLGRA